MRHMETWPHEFSAARIRPKISLHSRTGPLLNARLVESRCTFQHAPCSGKLTKSRLDNVSIKCLKLYVGYCNYTAVF